MLGAIIGDIVGSRFEFINHSGKDFEMFTGSCHYTDDTLMTLAVANALYLCRGNYDGLGKVATRCMVDIAHRHPNVIYGERFTDWLFKGQRKLNSYGNGAGMRISPVGWVADSEEEVKTLSRQVTEISHDHPEGIKGAECVAMAVYLARIGKNKEYIRRRLAAYYPVLNDGSFTIEGITGSYGYDEAGDWITCQGSIPQAVIAFLDGENFEDVIRNAVSIGGDSDTIGAMAGGIAEAYYGISYEMEEKALSYLEPDMQGLCYAFELVKRKRVERLV
ncbi:MAG: ADP-ribosylglycohydrolase family protein [Candidatus Coproplasma sp.]